MSTRELLESSLETLSFIAAQELLDDRETSYRLKELLTEVERKVILNTLHGCNNNQSEASRVLGVSRTALIYKLKEYRLMATVRRALENYGERVTSDIDHQTR